MEQSGKAKARTSVSARVQLADGTWYDAGVISIDGKPATLRRRAWRRVRLWMRGR